MHKTLAKRPLQRRIIALAAAYVIALAGLIGSFAAAQAAAGVADDPGAVICHGEAAGEAAPGNHDSNGTACSDTCCVGCVIFAAALPPLPSKIIGPAQSRPILPPPVFGNLTTATTTQSHRSRAPPLHA